MFFKEQTYLHVILPTPDQEKKVKHYLIVIFILKVTGCITNKVRSCRL